MAVAVVVAADMEEMGTEETDTIVEIVMAAAEAPVGMEEIHTTIGEGMIAADAVAGTMDGMDGMEETDGTQGMAGMVVTTVDMAKGVMEVRPMPQLALVTHTAMVMATATCTLPTALRPSEPLDHHLHLNPPRQGISNYPPTPNLTLSEHVTLVKKSTRRNHACARRMINESTLTGERKTILQLICDSLSTRQRCSVLAQQRIRTVRSPEPLKRKYLSAF